MKRLERLPDGRVRVGMKRVWFREPHELSDGWTFGALAYDDRMKLQAPLRSRCRKDVNAAFTGHPWKPLVVPALHTSRAGGVVRTTESIAAPELDLCPALEAVCAALGGAP